MQMKSSMTSIRVICIEREKDIFKSREVNCLKECALALITCLMKEDNYRFMGRTQQRFISKLQTRNHEVLFHLSQRGLRQLNLHLNHSVQSFYYTVHDTPFYIAVVQGER